jgi:class 3 adenylate cyclase/predicted ATPase
MDIQAWLRELGLERYAQVFQDNEIEPEILAELTDEDFKELGIPLGPRRKLAKAIAALSTEPATPSDHPAVVASAATPFPQAERRQLTVMFVDLVGSTALAARLDPEDMAQAIRAYQSCCTEAVERWDGHVAKYMGDGVLAYFGWPQAHEDEAERAVRAGLAIIAAVAGMSTPAGQPLAARVGIATGLVMVGELIGEGAAREHTVVGDTPNLAARLQALAQPGTVVIGQGTRRLVGGLFKLTDLGPQRLKGFAAPLAAWRVEGTGRAEGRFEALHGQHLTPLVGREHELGLLLDRFEQAREGEGQVVLLAGEPGIGKSRLAHALFEALGRELHTRLRYYCSPYHTASALHPVIEQLERAAVFATDDPAERKLDKLEALLSEGTNEVAAVAPLFAALLGLPVDRYPTLDLPAQRQRERTIQAMVDQLAGLAGRRPLVLMLEDAHWLDPTTTELFERVIAQVQTLPALVLITFRPEFQPSWTSYPHITALTLNRLGRRHSAEMIAVITGGKPLPDEVLAQIWTKTEGVPLFVEELTKAVLESGLLEDRNDHFALAGPPRPLAIPATLQDSLMARLDRLASVKEVAQIGAVIGREFPYPLLAAVSPLDQLALQDALSELAAAELIFRRGTIPDATYSFKHVFVQDAAYDSLVKSRRQQLHARIARVLEARFPDKVASQPELVAAHYRASGLTEEAIAYWQKAGQLAIEHSAAAEAVSHLEQALDLLGELPLGQERQARELELRVAMGAALIAAKGYAAPETVAAYARACELCAEIDDTQRLVRAHYGQAVVHMLCAEHEPALRVAQSLLGQVVDHHDPALVLMGHRIVGAAFFHLGQFDAAREHLERAITLYDPVRDRALALQYAEDPRVAGLSWLSWTLVALGYSDQANARSAEAIAGAHEFPRNTLAYALAWDGVRAQLVADPERVRHTADELVALSTERGFPLWLALGMVLRGWALIEAGRVDDGIEQLNQGVDGWQATGAEGWVPYFLGLLAEGCRKADRPMDALALLDDALLRVKHSGARWIAAELHRQRGATLLTLAHPQSTGAEACFRHAIDVARAQRAKGWELRATTALAGLLRDQDKSVEAHDLLAPVYGWFTEGFDKRDLKDAKALLDELA